MKRSLKKNYKLILGMIIGVIISGVGVYAATTISSSNISYNNSASGLTSTNMKGAIDELYEKSDIRKQGNFISAYTYSTATSTKCITGEESTCKKSSCYKSKTSGSCKAGDIIKYKVNDTDIITFHVMFDNGTTLTMQSQKNIISTTVWGSSISSGPSIIVPALEKATDGWGNVNTQTYALGSTSFAGHSYTCGGKSTCTTNPYTWSSRSAKARLITYKEVFSLGMGSNPTDGSHGPIWLYNYLALSTQNGGTKNDSSGLNHGYWTSNIADNGIVSVVYHGGAMISGPATVITSTPYGARAVVVVNK